LNECSRRIGNHGDVIGSSSDQSGDIAVCLVDLVTSRIGGFVGADLRFELQVLDARVEHRLRHQRGARVVHVIAIGTSRGFAAPLRKLIGAHCAIGHT